MLAAEIATVDHLSNGRVNVGVGAGWMPEELAEWRGPIQRELEELGHPEALDALELCSMYWFVITARLTWRSSR